MDTISSHRRIARPCRVTTGLFLFWILATCTAWGQTSTVIGWGLNDDGQASPPAGLTDAVRVAGGFRYSLAVRANGTVVGWGNNPGVPPGLNGIAALATRGGRNQALRSNGTVAAWSTFEPDFAKKVPAGLSNVIAVAEEGSYSLALRDDGSVAIWGSSSRTNLPSGLSNIVAIAAAGDVGIAARSDGAVIAWDRNGLIIPGFVPPGLSNVVAVAASHFDHCMALKSDGTVVNWGRSAGGVGPVPAGLSKVVAIAAEALHAMALRSDGTVLAWGSNEFGERNVPARATNVTAIALGNWHGLAVARSTPAPWPRLTAQPQSVREPAGQSATFSVTAEAIAPLSYRWQFRGRDLPGQTNGSLVLNQLEFSQAGDYAVVVSAGGLAVRSAPAFLAVSQPPAANAGPDQIAECNGAWTRVVLDGRGSSDVDDSNLAFSWFEGTGLLGTNPVQEVPLPAGVHTIRLTVRNSSGASGQDSVTVRVVDATPPSLECPGDLAAEFAGVTGAVVSFSVVATDVCSGVLSTCVPPSGDTFGIGSTRVQCTAEDEAGNRAWCGFSVTVLGPRAVKQRLLAEVEGLGGDLTDERDARRLSRALRRLTESLDPVFWADETHLVWRDGDAVFEHDKVAARLLRKTARDNAGSIPAAALEGILARLLRVDRALATVSVDEGAAGGAGPEKEAEERRQLAAGDEAAASGRPEKAIEHYRNAWRHAALWQVRAVVRVVAGRRWLQFTGWPGETYTIQSSTNLIDWLPLGTAQAGPEGVIEFDDREADGVPVRFYRVLAP